ncbi:preprotein translocase subunit SecE [Listeria fleischmannii 1991]|jgi:preprotein translocase subunit SecE|uniref:Protein translocase subunit SecE n=3 Tax=Listeria fleischmannii TaxID=1069827 RepID=W7DBI5_9LIST|nr:preprotein translocase subunit SecE [Listeria fleischmannii]EIA20371.1 preprotein translocase subunit SecE [Listeria fleischmannii subsp. coloradonensis]EUJ44841.1 preprotein translocase subunit SecE [Listeria fleischmannii FSL S10-1203]KMT58634.1 preprotein translocase subunit SecE [Listeria fleischmannii 1991]MBC1399180.1 preprotein translocase subunit SecE [Listeria fleischmannii]MBC1419215.1 preprotein translocase subunit SecE [Listeria fleischmannii]
MSAIARFFKNVTSEMRKVTWPTRKELTSYTVTVVITVILFAVFFMLLDFGIEQLIQLIL